MVSTDPAKRPVESRRIEGSRFGAGRGQKGPDPPRIEIQRAEPIAEDPHTNTLSRAFRERFGDFEPHGVPVNHVGLEMDRALR